MPRAAKSFALIALAVASPLTAATIQQDFDAGQALLDAGKFGEARAAFTALLARFPPASRGRAATVVRARLGNALIATGDSEAAEALLTIAIPNFAGPKREDVEERALATFDLGRALESRGALEPAAASYRAALASGVFSAAANTDLRVRLALARTAIWSAPDESRRLLDDLLARPSASFGKNTDTLAQIKTLRGRVELNNGNPKLARDWFQKAAATAGGGETTNINVADVRIRSDLTLANYILGNMNEVARNTAFSGAGGLIQEGFSSAANTTLPACAPLTGLAPDAVAVVEFGIADDGRVRNVVPIYVSLGAAAATTAGERLESLFAAAVHKWYWSADSVAKLDAFWRQAVRVEVRCFTSRPQMSPTFDSFRGEVTDWFAAIGIGPAPVWPDSEAANLPMMRAELARREREFGSVSPQLLPVLDSLAENTAASEMDRTIARTRRMALLNQHRAPAAVLGLPKLQDLRSQAARASTPREVDRKMRDGVASLLASVESAGQGDTRIAMLMRVELAEAHDRLKETAAARALYDRVVAAPVTLLPAADPLRTTALLLLSNQAAAARDVTTAAAALAATGLSPEQCALVDIRPQKVNGSVAQSDFPQEALRWGTGGILRVGYDITADGRTTNVRTILASPPFIFGPATERAVARWRYSPVFRPGNTVGCTGSTQDVRYQVRRE